jgi:hypothetical protein
VSLAVTVIVAALVSALVFYLLNARKQRKEAAEGYYRHLRDDLGFSEERIERLKRQAVDRKKDEENFWG